jgi:AraC-like DNA-binding protein
MVPAGRGMAGFEQTFTGSDTRVVVTHGAFMVSRVEVCSGRLFFPLASGDVEAKGRFILRLPPRCAMPMRFEDARVESMGVAGFGSAPFSTAAILEDAEANWLDRTDVLRLANASMRDLLDPDQGVDADLVRARSLLHEAMIHPAPVRLVARRLSLRADVLSRSFVRAYHLPPKQYCQRARLFEAVLRLATGAGIIESALLAGFGDLKRFYAQFRRLLGTTPGIYSKVKKRQDTATQRGR